MIRVKVLGIGSPAGDDCVGWLAVEALATSPLLSRLPPELSISTAALDRPGAALLHHLQGAQAAVIVDALAAGGPPGGIERLEAQELAAEAATMLSGHSFGVGSALALGRTLGLLPEPLVVLGVRIGQAEQGSGPSAPVTAAVPAVVERIVAELEKIADGG